MAGAAGEVVARREGGEGVTPGQKRAHAVVWTVLGPLLLCAVAVILLLRGGGS